MTHDCGPRTETRLPGGTKFRYTDEVQRLSYLLEEANQKARWRRRDFIEAMTVREYTSE